MNTNRKVPTPIIIAMPILLLFALGAYIVIQRAESSRADIPVLGHVPDFEFTAHTGEPFGSEQMRGKINIVEFFFTTCRGPCPVMNANMSELYEMFDGYDDIRFVSISVDPEHDTPEVLREYAEDFGLDDDRWIFLHAPIDSVVWLSEKGFYLAADNLPSMHSTKFVLVDGWEQIRGYYSGTDESSIKIMITHIRELVKNKQ